MRSMVLISLLILFQFGCTISPMNNTLQNATKMKKYGYQGKLKAKAGKGAELAEILLEAAESISGVQGCHMYMVSLDAADRDVIWVTEVWDSKEDHDNSLKASGVKELIGRAMPLFEAQPQKGQELEIIGGYGLPAMNN